MIDLPTTLRVFASEDHQFWRDYPSTHLAIGMAAAKIEGLKAALKPFAEIGEKLRQAVNSGAIPQGSSARFLKLEPLTALQFVEAADAYEQNATAKTENQNAL